MTELPVLTLALPPNMANKRPHWSEKARYIHGTKRIVGANALIVAWRSGTVDPNGWRLKRPNLYWTVYTHQRMDEDNLWARLKWPLDVLVQNGVLIDDKPEHIGKQTVTNEIDRKNQRVELRVTF